MPLRDLSPIYYWTFTRSGALLVWDGLVVGVVRNDGAWRAEWRGHRHQGTVGDPQLARRFMERWFAHRPSGPPYRRRGRPSESSLMMTAPVLGGKDEPEIEF